MANNPIIEKLTPEKLKQTVFIYTQLSNIKQMLPLVLKALEDRNLLTNDMVCYAMGTIFVENSQFTCIAEKPSKWSTKSKTPPFDFSNYENRMDLGNTYQGDGAKFKGRGLLQVTGRKNYLFYSQELGLGNQLIDNPDSANDPKVASSIFAEYLKQNRVAIEKAIKDNDFKAMRRIVNGPACLHTEEFKDAYLKVKNLLS